MQFKNDFYYLVSKNIYLNREKNIDIYLYYHTLQNI